jgi:hypothetical protein
MSREPFSLVQEYTNKYFIKDLNENEIEICIRFLKNLRHCGLSKYQN